MPRYRSSAFMAIVTVLLLVISGCGSDEPDTMASGSKPGGEPIKIGMAVAISGPQASSNQSAVGAAKAWAAETNASGGLGGRPVEVVIEDTKNDAAAAQAAVKRLTGQSDIVAMLLVDPVAEGPVAKSVQDASIPVIGATGYAQDVWNKLPNFFMTSNNSLTVITSEIYAAAAAGATTFGAAVCAETSTCAEGANAAYTPSADKLGINYAGAIQVSSTAPDYTAECLNFMDKKVDAISMIIPVDTSVRLMSDCVQQGYQGIFVTAAGSFDTEQFNQVKGLHIVGTLNGFPWWVNDPQVERYREAMEKYSSDTVFEHTSGTTVWSSLELFRKAIGDDTTSLTRDKVFSAYYGLTDETLDGLLPQPLSFAEGKASPSVDCFWQIDDTTGDDKNPELIKPEGEVGNGVEGDLATTCAAG